jgi:hypothetical protein
LAISNAEKCIKAFRDYADDQPAELENSKAPQPPDDVTEQEKQKILKRGLLNDVATCFWI